MGRLRAQRAYESERNSSGSPRFTHLPGHRRAAEGVLLIEVLLRAAVDDVGGGGRRRWGVDGGPERLPPRVRHRLSLWKRGQGRG